MLSFTIRLSTGTKWTIALEEGATVATTTVLQVKEHLLTLKDQHEYLNDATIDTIRLIFKGRILENERALSDYQIVPDATLFLVKSANRSNASPATPSNTTTATSPHRPSPAAAAPPVPPASSINTTAPLFNSWGASGFGGPPPSLDSMMNHPPSQEQMNQVLNNPMIQSMLDNNPDFLRNMLQSQMQNNPQLRQMMESNPALAQMMNDPAALDQAMQMMRNPAAFQQALRQQDLALSQLENMPGGMAALSSMYQQYQQPLEESMIGGGSNASDTSNNNANRNGEGSLAGASGQAMPNPWGNSSSSRSVNSSPTRPANPMMNPWANMGAMANTSGTNNQSVSDMFSPFGGLGGMPAPGMAPSPEQRQAVLQMMENPAVQNMMQQAIQQNPEMFRQALLAQNPMMEQMFRDNPAMLDQMMQQMMNPQTLRAMFQMQDQLQGLNIGQSGYSAEPLNFSNLLGGMAPAAEQRPPAERYAVQLRSLYDMGFDDEQRNLQALDQVHGNLNRAVDFLLTMPVASTPTPTSAPADRSTAPDEGASSDPKEAEDKKND
jgi:ubiquilin